MAVHQVMLVTAFLSVASVAHADPAPPAATTATTPDAWQRRFSVSGVLGLATPLGFGGVQLAFAPARPLELTAGVGRGDDGVQVAVGARLRGFGRRWSGDVGSSLSAGRYDRTQSGWFFSTETNTYTWERAVWGNFEVGISRRHDNGAQFRLFFGVGAILNEDGCVQTSSSSTEGGDNSFDVGPCGDLSDGPPMLLRLPYTGISVGWAF